MSRPLSPVVDTPTVTEEPLTAAAIRAMIHQEVMAVLRDALPPPASVTLPVPTSEAPGSSVLGENQKMSSIEGNAAEKSFSRNRCSRGYICRGSTPYVDSRVSRPTVDSWRSTASMVLEMERVHGCDMSLKPICPEYPHFYLELYVSSRH